MKRDASRVLHLSLYIYIYTHIYLSSTSKHKCRNFAIKYWRNKIMRTHESNSRQNCLLIEHFRGVEAGRAKQIQISVSRKWLRGPLSGRSLTVRTPIGGFPGRCELIYNVLDARLPVTLRSPCVYMCVYICVCVCVCTAVSIDPSFAGITNIVRFTTSTIFRNVIPEIRCQASRGRGGGMYDVCRL